MAIRNSVSLMDNSGRSIPANNIIVSCIGFNYPVFNENAEGEWDNTIKRIITYELRIFTSVQHLKDSKGLGFVSGGVKEFPLGWAKEMTEQEYNDLRSNGALAEVWLKDYIQNIIGGNSTVIDPFA